MYLSFILTVVHTGCHRNPEGQETYPGRIRELSETGMGELRPEGRISAMWRAERHSQKLACPFSCNPKARKHTVENTVTVHCILELNYKTKYYSLKTNLANVQIWENRLKTHSLTQMILFFIVCCPTPLWC